MVEWSSPGGQRSVACEETVDRLIGSRRDHVREASSFETRSRSARRVVVVTVPLVLSESKAEGKRGKKCDKAINRMGR